MGGEGHLQCICVGGCIIVTARRPLLRGLGFNDGPAQVTHFNTGQGRLARGCRGCYGSSGNPSLVLKVRVLSAWARVGVGRSQVRARTSLWRAQRNSGIGSSSEVVSLSSSRDARSREASVSTMGPPYKSLASVPEVLAPSSATHSLPCVGWMMTHDGVLVSGRLLSWF